MLYVLFQIAVLVHNRWQLTVLGTPAEEGGCGKGYLIDGGGFDGIDAAMMAHPTGPTPCKVIVEPALIAVGS